MKYYHDNSVIRHGSDPVQADIGLGSDVIVGRFVDVQKPTFGDLQQEIAS
jgi:hypothetical protein